MHEELPSLDPNYFRCLLERWRTWSVVVAVMSLVQVGVGVLVISNCGGLSTSNSSMIIHIREVPASSIEYTAFSVDRAWISLLVTDTVMAIICLVTCCLANESPNCVLVASTLMPLFIVYECVIYVVTIQWFSFETRVTGHFPEPFRHYYGLLAFTMLFWLTKEGVNITALVGLIASQTKELKETNDAPWKPLLPADLSHDRSGDSSPNVDDDDCRCHPPGPLGDVSRNKFKNGNITDILHRLPHSDDRRKHNPDSNLSNESGNDNVFLDEPRSQVVTLPRMGLILGDSTPRANDATETKPPSCGFDLLSSGSIPDVFRPFSVNASLGGTPYHDQGTDSSGGFKKRYGRSQNTHNQTPVGREEVIVIVHSDVIDHILWDVQPEVLTGSSTDLVGSHDCTLMQIKP